AFELLGACLRLGELVARCLLQLVATRFELGDVVGRGERGLALRQQEVAAVARLHFDAVADVAEVGDFLQKNDFHESTLPNHELKSTGLPADAAATNCQQNPSWRARTSSASTTAARSAADRSPPASRD